jgi:hypothetical protein
VSYRNLSRKKLLAESTTANDDWVRNPEWIPLTPPAETGFTAIYAVFPGCPNPATMTVTGAYTVDWGDGSPPQNVASNTQASKLYDYDDLPANTRTSEGFRQAHITVTMQGGANMTKFDINVRHASYAFVYDTGWMDIELKSDLISTFTVSAGTVLTRHSMLERFVWADSSNAVTNMNYIFQNCVKLGYVEIGYSGLVTNFTSAFINCYRLKQPPAGLTTGAATNTTSMFQNCYSLTSVPDYDLTKVTTATSMFNTCLSLQAPPAATLNLNVVTNTASMFNACYQMATIPVCNMPLCTTATSMFASCYSVTTIPSGWTTGSLTSAAAMFNTCVSLVDADNTFDVSGTTTATTFFQNCYQLESIGEWNFASATICSSIFAQCYRLRTVPALNFTAATNFDSLFANCTSLVSITPWTGSAPTTVISMFSGCTSLLEVPVFSLAGVASGAAGASMLVSCVSLQSFKPTGMRVAISFSGFQMLAAQLDEMYTNLGTASGTQAVTVTNNPGTTGDTPSIATAKGWTVTGS